MMLKQMYIIQCQLHKLQKLLVQVVAEAVEDSLAEVASVEAVAVATDFKAL